MFTDAIFENKASVRFSFVSFSTRAKLFLWTMYFWKSLSLLLTHQHFFFWCKRFCNSSIMKLSEITVSFFYETPDINIIYHLSTIHFSNITAPILFSSYNEHRKKEQDSIEGDHFLWKCWIKYRVLNMIIKGRGTKKCFINPIFSDSKICNSMCQLNSHWLLILYKCCSTLLFKKLNGRGKQNSVKAIFPCTCNAIFFSSASWRPDYRIFFCPICVLCSSRI